MFPSGMHVFASFFSDFSLRSWARRSPRPFLATSCLQMRKFNASTFEMVGNNPRIISSNPSRWKNASTFAVAKLFKLPLQYHDTFTMTENCEHLQKSTKAWSRRESYTRRNSLLPRRICSHPASTETRTSKRNMFPKARKPSLAKRYEIQSSQLAKLHSTYEFPKRNQNTNN